jgi:hypothetical protein
MHVDKKDTSSSKDHFGSTSPFKVQVNFYIPIFEGQIDADALEKWLNLLEGYFFAHNFSDREKITFTLLREKKLIQMGLMKDPKSHGLTMHDGRGSSKQNVKEGYSKPFNDSSGSKDSSDSKNKKKGKQCTYCNKPNHEESTCMNK